MTETESHEVTDSLKLKLVDGETGKVKYDTQRDDKTPKFMLPPQPLTFCPACGHKELQTLIWYCQCCGNQYQQIYDAKTKRVMISTMPEAEPSDGIP